MKLLPTLILLSDTPVVHNGWLLIGHGIHGLLNAICKMHGANAVPDDSCENVLHGVVDTKVRDGRLNGRFEATFVDDEVHEEVSEIVGASATVDSNHRVQGGVHDLAASHVITVNGGLDNVLDGILGAGLGVHGVADGSLDGAQRLKAVLHGPHLILSSVELRGLGRQSFLLGIKLLLEPCEVRRHLEDVTVMMFQGMRNWGEARQWLCVMVEVPRSKLGERGRCSVDDGLGRLSR